MDFCFKALSITDHNDPMFSDIQVLANSAAPDHHSLEEQSDQGPHCLLFHLHVFEDAPQVFASILEF